MAKLIENNFGNFLVIFLIFSLVTGWVFSGWPQIWQKPAIPPETIEILIWLSTIFALDDNNSRAKIVVYD